MKKLPMMLILTLAMVLSAVGCSNEQYEESMYGKNAVNESVADDKIDNKPTSEIPLTVDNLEDYLAIEFDFSKDGYYADVTMETFAVAAGGFNNVKISVEIDLPWGWVLSSGDEMYDGEETSNFSYTFRLPASGEYTETHHSTVSFSYDFVDPDGDINYTITSVSGTFAPMA